MIQQLFTNYLHKDEKYISEEMEVIKKEPDGNYRTKKYNIN